MSARPESQLVVIYAPPKRGKTSDVGYAFPHGVFFAPSANALAPLRTICGYTAKRAVVKSLDPVMKFVRDHAEDESVSAVVIDDIALLAEVSLKNLQAKGYEGWSLYGAIKDLAIELCVIARSAPWHLVLTSHETAPEVDPRTGAFQPGGPTLPGRKAGPEIKKNASVILRAVVEAKKVTDADALGAAEGPPEDPLAQPYFGYTDDAWRGIYSCDMNDPNWTVGNRLGSALTRSPQNIREILHAGGISNPRVYDWQEDFVEKLSNLLLDGKLTDAAATQLVKAIEARVDHTSFTSAVYWTQRDAFARAYLRRHQGEQRSKLWAALGAK